MKKKSIQFIFFALCFVLSSCSSKDKLNVVLDSYIGYSADALYQRLGNPVDILEDGDKKMLVYGFRRSSYRMQPTYSSFGYGRYGRGLNSLGYAGAGLGYTTVYECHLSFIVNKQSNKVLSSSYSGNSCDTYAKRKYVNPRFIVDLPERYSRELGFTYKHNKKGLKITQIHKESQAYKVGLRDEDIITKINGKSFAKLPVEFADDVFASYDSTTLEVLRNKEVISLNIKKTDFPLLSLYKNSTKKFLGF